MLVLARFLMLHLFLHSSAGINGSRAEKIRHNIKESIYNDRHSMTLIRRVFIQ